MTEDTFSLRKEFIAGITTFFTMAYIVVVNPTLLSNAGLDYGSVFVATCLSAACGCFLMGFLANYPIALAPSMSLNAYFSFYVIQQLHFSWQAALGIVFISGILFALLSLTSIRQWIIFSMPQSIMQAIVGGIGLFLVAIALKTLGMHWKTFLIGSAMVNKKIWLSILGVLLAVILDRFRLMGAILISMIIITLLGFFFDLVHITSFIAMPPSLEPTFLKLTLPPFTLESFVVILIFLFVALFDNTGTLVAILHQAKLLPETKHHQDAPRLSKALLADSLASTVGALFGTSPTGSYIESAAGVAAGGRKGLTAIFVGILFICALFFSPIAKAIPDYASAAALIYIGILMSKNFLLIPWKDITQSLPALICALIIPISFSIADGVAAGFVSYVLLKWLKGKTNELNWGLWVIAGLSVVYFVVRI